MTHAQPTPAASSDKPPLRRAGVWGWMLFDVAAQPFFTVVLTFVFGPYFVGQLAPDPATGQVWWAGTATVAGIVMALASPVLGAVADRAGPRKPWIAALAAVKVSALALLWFAAPGSPLLYAALLVGAAQIAAELSGVFNDAMMPRLVSGPAVGRVSNVAWGLGYAGGLVFLFATLAFLAASPETGRTLLGLAPLFGLDAAFGEGARASAPLAGLWYLVFILPMLLLTPDRPAGAPLGAAVRAGLADLRATLGEARRRPMLVRFLLARMLYQDGINALLVLGGAFAAGMFGWSIVESGVFGILLNVAAIAGCLLAGALDARVGSRAVVLACVAVLGVATLGLSSTEPGSTLFGLVAFAAPASEAGGLFATAAEKSYLAFGLLVGLAFGPVQASSRAMLARAVAEEEAGRYFGLYALSGRATAFLAPGLVALLTSASLAVTDPLTASRIGMGGLVLFFAAGFALLLRVRLPAR